MKSAAEIMDRNILVLDAAIPVDKLSEIAAEPSVHYVLVSSDGKILGWIRTDSALTRKLDARTDGLTLRRLAQSWFIFVRDNDTAGTVVRALCNRPGEIAIVVEGNAAHGARHVLGVIGSEHRALALSDSVHVYTR